MFAGALPAVGSPPGVRSDRLAAVLAVQAADAIDDGQERDRAGGQKVCAHADESGRQKSNLQKDIASYRS